MNKKILIVEDDLTLFQIYMDLFIEKGFDVKGAKTGQEAVALIESEKRITLADFQFFEGSRNGLRIVGDGFGRGGGVVFVESGNDTKDDGQVFGRFGKWADGVHGGGIGHTTVSTNPPIGHS